MANKYQQIGAFATIPFVLLVPPIIGWLLGRWIDKKIDSHPFFMYTMILLGFAAGVRECYKIIKKFGNED